MRLCYALQQATHLLGMSCHAAYSNAVAVVLLQDGTNWARIEGEHHTHAIFDRGEAGDFDAVFVAQPQVLAAGPNDMRLYYYTFDASQQRFCIGLATSENGLKCAACSAEALRFAHVIGFLAEVHAACKCIHPSLRQTCMRSL